MTWNVENLFDVGAEAGPEAQAQLAAKIESLRAVIDAQAPHIVALQEIGSESALARLQAALVKPMPHRALAQPDDRDIRVGFISRRVLHDPIPVRPFPGGLLPIQVGDDPPGRDGPRTMSEMGRGALQVTVRANNRDVHIIAAHMKSKLLTFLGGSFTPDDEDQRARSAAFALYRRASEATTLRSHLDAVLADLERPARLGDRLCGFDQPDQGDERAVDRDRVMSAHPLSARDREDRPVKRRQVSEWVAPDGEEVRRRTRHERAERCFAKSLARLRGGGSEHL